MNVKDPLGLPVPGRFESLGAWFNYVRQKGFSVPVQAPRAISLAMKTFDMGHQEAFAWLLERRLLIIDNRSVIVDMRAIHVDLRAERGKGMDPA